MRKRHTIGKKHSKRMFTRHAKRVHGKNLGAHPMRGGIRA